MAESTSGAISFKIEGMTCASCVVRVEKALRGVAGVASASVNLATERATVLTRGTGLKRDDLLAAVEYGGYRATTSRETSARGTRTHVAFWRVALAAALSIPLVLPMLLHPLGNDFSLPAWLQLALAATVQFWLGARFYSGAWKAVRAGAANMDVLVAIGTTAAFALSLARLREHHLYFESAAVIITFVLFGKWLESRAKLETTSAIRALAALQPPQALVRRDGRDVMVSVDELARGDLLVVRAGERIAADGVVTTGESEVDESLLTGESLPVKKGVGSMLTGGAVNGDGLLLVRVTEVGAETALARIIRTVEDAQAGKAPIQRAVDKVSAIFVPVVLGIAAVTFVAWWIAGGDATIALLNAVAVLVIACPCALGLATPAAIMVGTGAAARGGILIRNTDVLAVASRVRTVAFDKTGTLTEGRPLLERIVGFGEDEDTVLRLAAGLQASSEHPLARAARARAVKNGLTGQEMRDLVSLPGRGVSGVMDGKIHILGSARLMRERGVPVAEAADLTAELEASGYTLAWLAEPAGRQPLLGLLAFKDEVREEAAAAIASLKNDGAEVVMVTGDNRQTAIRVAAELGVAVVEAEALPADKAALIQKFIDNKAGAVAMVGDGVNDAPALATADIGIAIGGGTDVAAHAAAITLMRADLTLVEAALDISSRTYRKIRQNLFWAFAYNAVGIPLAGLGLLSPAVAGGAMALSSVSVVANALLLRRWRPVR